MDVMYVVTGTPDAPDDAVVRLAEALSAADKPQGFQVNWAEISAPDGMLPEVEGFVSNVCQANALRYRWFDVLPSGFVS
jgi:hypothetical protein